MLDKSIIIGHKKKKNLLDLEKIFQIVVICCILHNLRTITQVVIQHRI